MTNPDNTLSQKYQLSRSHEARAATAWEAIRHCRLETASGSLSWPDGGLKCEWNDRTPDAAMKADRPGVLLLED
jgi:hypothetical protein